MLTLLSYEPDCDAALLIIGAKQLLKTHVQLTDTVFMFIWENKMSAKKHHIEDIVTQVDQRKTPVADKLHQMVMSHYGTFLPIMCYKLNPAR